MLACPRLWPPVNAYMAGGDGDHTRRVSVGDEMAAAMSWRLKKG